MRAAPLPCWARLGCETRHLTHSTIMQCGYSTYKACVPTSGKLCWPGAHDGMNRSDIGAVPCSETLATLRLLPTRMMTHSSSAIAHLQGSYGVRHQRCLPGVVMLFRCN